MRNPPTSSVEVQLHACGRLALVRAGQQRPLHLTRDGVRDAIAKLQAIESQMVAPAPAVDPRQYTFPPAA